jgi:hypothetical protein
MHVYKKEYFMQKIKSLVENFTQEEADELLDHWWQTNQDTLMHWWTVNPIPTEYNKKDEPSGGSS